MSRTPAAKTQTISILYRDESLIVVDKPAGLLVIPSPKGEKTTLGTLLNDLLAAETVQAGKPRPQAHPAHRIDRETSGIMLYALGKSMQQKLMDRFAAREVHKTYIAVVNGIPGKKEGSLNQPIEGQEALTRFKVLGSKDLGQGKAYSVVAAEPVTGRTNQIRIHFSRMGHPLIGDAKFGVRKDFAVQAKRCLLHAYRISFPHPADDSELVFVAPTPADMEAIVAAAGVETAAL